MTHEITTQNIREYLIKRLKMLHQMDESTIDMIDSAVVQGSIIMVEEMFAELLHEDAPSKSKLFERTQDIN